MTGLPARLDRWASVIRNPVHEPGGDLRHDGFTDREAMELSTLLTEAANNIRSVEKAYEQGYRDGGSSNAADWTHALVDVLPDGMEVYPSLIAAHIELLLAMAGDGYARGFTAGLDYASEALEARNAKEGRS